VSKGIRGRGARNPRKTKRGTRGRGTPDVERKTVEIKSSLSKIENGGGFQPCLKPEGGNTREEKNAENSRETGKVKNPGKEVKKTVPQKPETWKKTWCQTPDRRNQNQWGKKKGSFLGLLGAEAPLTAKGVLQHWRKGLWGRIVLPWGGRRRVDTTIKKN